jgi:NAD(P)-dependent dehydrogenase (short-subunit alcohol dehydrogenase family)
MATPFDLHDKVAVITGSSRGIGRAIAESMSALRAKVVISSRKGEACEAVVREIEARGSEAIAVPCNISRRLEVEALVQETTSRFGRVDILVCNAAVNPVFGPLLHLADEAFDKVINANVKSTLWLCNLAIPGMAARGGGAVIVVSSIAGLRGTDAIGMYGISKAADFALVRNLAVEWGPRNVRVNCIAPGLIKTDFARALWENEDLVRRRNAQTPLRRIGMPEEIGPVAAFLASDAASFITGQIIVADGGITAAT